MFQHLPFPYEGGVFPKRLGAVVQLTVLDGEEPARLVVHDEASGWAVGDGINDPNETGGGGGNAHLACCREELLGSRSRRSTGRPHGN